MYVSKHVRLYRIPPLPYPFLAVARALQLDLAVGGPPGDTYEVDAVAVAGAVGDVVAEVGAVDRDALAVGQDAHVLPHHLLVAERRPPVRVRLARKLLEAAAHRRDEERLAAHAVVVDGLDRAVDLLQEVGRLPVAAVLGVMAVERADLSVAAVALKTTAVMGAAVLGM